MPTKPRVLCFAGSLRRDSFNKKLVKVAIPFVEEAGGQATYIDLKELDLPIYDGDFEAEHGLPADARRLKKLFMEHDALLISAPEYNSSITAVLKNAIDWVSRPEQGEAALCCYENKVAGLLAASPGALGGLRGLVTVRSILSNIKVLVIPEQFALAQAHNAFDENGALKDEKQIASVKAVAQRLVDVTASICSRRGAPV